MNVSANVSFISECITQAKIKKPIKCPIVSICGERKTIFLSSTGSNISLDTNSKIAALIMNMKKVK
jgi:hypothetical protein